jgi:hypothetical protein
MTMNQVWTEDSEIWLNSQPKPGDLQQLANPDAIGGGDIFDSDDFYTG